MRNLLKLPLTLSILFLSAAGARAAELGVLQPVQAHGHALQRAAPGGGMAPVVRRLATGTLYRHLQSEARDGFTGLMLALDEAAQREAGARTVRPTWLFLSDEQGGFARRGFWLRSTTGTHYVDEPFVDLVVDQAAIDDGSFEEIFAHELGHVMLRRLLGPLPQGYSRTPHAALALTDRITAFDEGFAIHFQGLARRFTGNPRLREEDLGLAPRPLVGYWASNVDRAIRLEGMRRNLFVQAQLPLPGIEEAGAAREHSPLFDPLRLKSGDQMMASEGVVATVFYRWLVAGPADRAAVLARYRRLMHALVLLGRDRPDADAPWLVDLLRTYRTAWPDAGTRALHVFVETTCGATVEQALPRTTERLARPGTLGDVDGFVAALKPAREQLRALEARVDTDPALLSAALGPPYWLASPQAAGSAAQATVLDLNTAEAAELATLPGIDPALAARMVAERQVHGPYADAAAVAARLGATTGPLPSTLARLHAAALALGTYPRR